jgi:hypothetical protein
MHLRDATIHGRLLTAAINAAIEREWLPGLVDLLSNPTLIGPSVSGARAGPTNGYFRSSRIAARIRPAPWSNERRAGGARAGVQPALKRGRTTGDGKLMNLGDR